MESKKDTVIFDIDGTLCDSFGRTGYPTQPVDWNSVMDEMKSYPVNEAVAQLADWAWITCWDIVIFTGRPARLSELTLQWLWDKEICHSRIFFRPDGDETEDAVLKKAWLNQLIAEGAKILFAVEDRTSVVKMFREAGIPCLQCAQGDY